MWKFVGLTLLVVAASAAVVRKDFSDFSVKSEDVSDNSVSSEAALAAKTPFYAIGHMANTIPAATWHLANGANGLEMDVQFDPLDGHPVELRHGGFCDCSATLSCRARLPFTKVGGVCGAVDCNCEASEKLTDMFNFLAQQEKLALVVLDSKIDGSFREGTLMAAGYKIVTAVIEELFEKGYKGNVVINTATPDAFTYIQAASMQSVDSAYFDRIHFAFDSTGGSGSNANCNLNVISRVEGSVVYGTGSPSYIPGLFDGALKAAVGLRTAGKIGLVYVWTVDSPLSMSRYALLGVNGMITNFPDKLSGVVSTLKLQLATPEDKISFGNVETDDSKCGCSCSLDNGGCRISFPAPKGKSCKCQKISALKTCTGTVVNCGDNNPTCRIPDSSVDACNNGKGDCTGYPPLF